jgi:hypothetical protein
LLKGAPVIQKFINHKNNIMATMLKMRLGKKPKSPKINAPKSSWDSYEKRKKDYDKQKSDISKEKDRRLKIKSK